MRALWNNNDFIILGIMMKKTLYLSLICASVLQAQEANLEKVTVEEKVNTTTVKNVSGEELKSADLAESLTKNVPGISIVRRSGIANDIILRGQKKDNINITIDGAKVCGACPNRMDPPTSHVLTNNVESVEVTEGPFDVENFGTLSGLVKINTKKPTEGFSGEVNLNAGSFGYKKGSATLSGGTENIRVLVSASKEQSDQYKDGNGDTLAEQLVNYTDGLATATSQYQDRYEDMKAFEKQSVMAKIFADVTDNQELRLSYTKNESDNILYPSSKMDALYDDSTIVDAGYRLENLGSLSKKLEIEAYRSEVDHPMSTKYRKASLNPMMGEMVSALTTEMSGVKVKNSFDAGSTAVTVGLDSSTRNWDGEYFKQTNVALNQKSMSDVDTVNSALFLKSESDMGAYELNVGLRYDTTTITPNAGTQQDNDYAALSANVVAIMKSVGGARYFAGLGKSSRVPDARELYFYASNGKEMGTPDLEQTTNTELDLGVEKEYQNGIVKTKLFYSKLSDFITYNASKEAAGNVFENVDATIYGLELSGSYMVSDALDFDYGLAYQRGQKDEALEGQSDKNLAEIPPMKLNIAANYAFDNTASAKIELIAADAWSNYDEENGEQELDAWQVVNIKAQKTFLNSLELTVGIDNIADNAYAVSNTYKDLTLMTGDTDVMLLNEPGRYVYTNLKYQF
jgi:iron complex outermembrane receptor protein